MAADQWWWYRCRPKLWVMFYVELILLMVCIYNLNCILCAPDVLEVPFPVNNFKGQTHVLCGAEKFPCGNTSVCLDRSQHCDGQKHCANGEDEEGCADVHGSLGPLLEKLMMMTQQAELHDISNFSSFENCSLQNISPECECRYFTSLFCKGENVTSVPQGVEGHITKMVLINTSIKYLPKGAFSEYTGLRIIHIEGNRMPRLTAGAFLGMENVTIMTLKNNCLEYIERGAFEGLENLQWLLIIKNNIVELDLNVFAGLPTLHILHLMNNKLVTLGSFPPLKRLFWLALGNNQIQKIDKTNFRNLHALEVLNLKRNRIEDVEEESFFHLFKLHELDISYNRLSFLRPKLFWRLWSLNKLNLEFNMMNSFPLDIFKELHSLKSLDLQGMEINNIDIHHFENLKNLEFIYFKRFLYCSYAPYVRICSPKTDGLSSTEHLLVWPALRMSVWVVALMTCMGNTVVLTWRVLSRKEDRVLSLFIKNLAVADLLMGIYLLAVGAQDISFRDKYNKYAHTWMSSWHCTACGVIAMVSSEVSVFILSLITIERYRCIRTNVRVKLSSARYSLGAIWTAGIVLALFPVLQWSQEFGFYSSNGLCFPLHIDDPFLLGWQYSAFVFFGINFTAVILIIVLYVRMFLIIRHDRQLSRPVVLKKHEDAVLALRFFFIVLTDCLCWIPIVIIKLLAFVGVTISHNLYACVVVFILPINSALNPVLYTIAAPTELRRKIQKWLERTVVCLHRLECLIISDPKTPASSPLTQSLTNTESRSVSNGSILPHGATCSSGTKSELDSCLEQNEQEHQDEISTII